MARTIMEIPFKGTVEEATGKVQGVLEQKGYHMLQYGQERVYKKGNGMMTAMQYIKPEYAEGKVTLYGWVQMGIGSVGIGELELRGIVGCVPKQMVKKVMKAIEAELV